MNMQDIRRMAKDMNLKIGRMTKAEAVRAIQLAEGNFDCYGRADMGHCDQGDCLFREDCLAASAKTN